MFRTLLMWILVGCLANANLNAQDIPTEPAAKKSTQSDAKDPLAAINKSFGKLRKIQLPEAGNIWIEVEKKLVVIDGMICLNRGPLEMFACPPNTKEHESIVQADTKSQIVHTALLMVGAKTGSPVKWEPKYQPAHGTKIEIEVHWIDKNGKHQKCQAQEMIRNVRTKKPMTESWVFAGSEFYVNPNNKKRTYMADGGEMICVSNFTTAMMDLPVESTQSADGLIFEAFTEKIPPLKTRVRLVLKPVIKKKKASKQEQNENENKSAKQAKEIG